MRVRACAQGLKAAKELSWERGAHGPVSVDVRGLCPSPPAWSQVLQAPARFLPALPREMTFSRSGYNKSNNAGWIHSRV